MGKLLRLLKCLCCNPQYGPQEPWLSQNFKGHREIQLIVSAVTEVASSLDIPEECLLAGVGCGLVIKLCWTILPLHGL